MAEQPFTESDVQFVAASIVEHDRTAGLLAPAPTRIHEGEARAVLTALAEAGRLLPPGVSIEEKFGVMGDETIVKTYRRPYVMGHASCESAEEYIADQREDWPDHNLRLVSRWSSPWVPVGTEETPE